jgi:hypothetical protein
MVTVNEVLKNKLLLQAEEAKEQGMTKLGQAIMDAVDETSTEEKYSYSQMNDEIHSDLWKIATHLMKYYNLQSVNADQLDKIVVAWSDKLVEDLELSLGVDEVINSSSDTKLPGEY